MSRILSIVAIILLAAQISAEAQVVKRKKAKSNEHPPKAILVQLFTYQRKIDYYTKLQQPNEIKLLKQDTDSMITRMVSDFNDNFYYCPVYYFIDTNAHRVIKKDLDGILLDAQLQPVKNPVISGKDDNYQIVIFGYPIQKPTDNLKKSEYGDFFSSNYSVTTAYKQRLVVFDDEFDKVPLPLPNGSNNVYGGALKKPSDHYVYTSKKFPIYYKPYAKNLSAKMYDFYGAYPYKK